MTENALSEFIFQSKYARFLPEKGRKETFEESIDRILQMHMKHLQDKYPQAIENSDFCNDFIQASESCKQGLIYGSQRALQFGGEPILKHNEKIYNCSFLYADKLDVFKTVEWLGLNGCGVGISVEKKHINKLPSMCQNLNENTYNHIISDDIEGWSYAVDALIRYFFDSGFKYPLFDFSLVRPKGSPISNGFLAPGPEPLKNALRKMEDLLRKVHKRKDKRLKPIEVTDLLALEADSIISGGVRRSALSILFDPDDEEMYNSKIGNWWYENPQRGRYNASAVLERQSTSKEVFNKLFESTKQFGEPGFVWRSDNMEGFNPCQPKWAPVITPNGLSTIGDIKVGDKIWSATGWTTVIKKWSTGIKPVYEYRTTGGVFYGTENHKLVSKGIKVEAKDCKEVDSLAGELYNRTSDFIPELVMDGLVIGDGTCHHASNDLITLCIGENDQEYFNSEIKDLILEHRPGINKYCWNIKTSISGSELKKKYEAEIPERLMKGTKLEICSLLRGLYSANGSVVSNRITYKTASKTLRNQIQLLLSYLGIRSYFTTNKPSKVQFSNGEYECKESYDINITYDRDRFVNLIGFIQQYKNDKINLETKSNKKHFTYPIKEVNFIREEEVFDITVDNDPHTYWTGGLNVSNCFEIGFKAVDEHGNTGVQFCNLVSISGKNITNEDYFYKACKDAATIATVQASYMEFPFLGEVTENIVKNDPLIGVSISGIMMNPSVLCNPNILRKGAEIIKEQNAKIAAILGINPSSRCTCVKPDGNLGAMTGNTSGCHGEHARRYIRRVQVNKEEEAGQIYAKYNPRACVESVWSNNHSDNCLMFAIEASPDCILKKDLLGVKQLEVVKLLQTNWVRAGKRDPNASIENNVSNTVQVDDWEAVKEYVWNNRNDLAGISFISNDFGELDYLQPAYSTVLTPSEIIEEYGEAAIFASGLIVDSIKVFGDLWKACDAVKGKGEKLFSTLEDAESFIKDFDIASKEDYLDRTVREWEEAQNKQYSKWVQLLVEMGYSEDFAENLLDNDIEISSVEIQKYLDRQMYNTVPNLSEKREIVRRLLKFADKYFDGEVSQMINMLKQVQLYHDWCDITKYYQPVDWSSIRWKKVPKVNVDTLAAASCSGGACEINKI